MPKSPDLYSPILSLGGGVTEALRTDARGPDEHDVLSTLLSEVRRFCGKSVDGAAIDARGKLGDEILSAVAERGWFGLTIPEAYGGAGLTLKAACRVVTELASFNGSLGTCVGLHSGLALYSLIHLASDSLKERYLPEIASGQRIAAFAATEPSAGSDIGAMQSLLREEGGKLLLRGSKCYVTNGALAGMLTTVAKSPGLGGARAGHTLMVIDPAWPGVTRHGEEHKLGLKGSSTITIDYEDVVVPRDHLVGEPSLGLEYAHRALTWGRTFMAAGCLGPARAAIAQTEEHTATRTQFGRPLLRFPLVRQQLAAARAEVYAIESMIRLVCESYDAGLTDIALPSAAAKITASEGAWRVVDRCLQLLGGIGYMEDAGMARRMRDLRVTRIFEGANDVLRLSLASATLGWPADPTTNCPSLASLSDGPLAAVASATDGTVARLLDTLRRIRKKYGFRLFDRQVLQAHLADAIVATYGAVACVLRARGAAPGTAAGSREIATATLAVRAAVHRANDALVRAEDPEQDAEQALVETVLGETGADPS
jgi:alkylation response protein AidB-like acyl-CoA dehydrogenase